MTGFPVCTQNEERAACTHIGKLHDCLPTGDDGYIIVYDTETASGHSGSAVMIVDESFKTAKHDATVKWLNDMGNFPSVYKAAISVHNGIHAPTGKQYGTLITPKIHQWITQTLKAYKAKGLPYLDENYEPVNH